MKIRLLVIVLFANYILVAQNLDSTTKTVDIHAGHDHSEHEEKPAKDVSSKSEVCDDEHAHTETEEDSDDDHIEEDAHDHSEHDVKPAKKVSTKTDACDDDHASSENKTLKKAEASNVLAVSEEIQKKIGLKLSKAGKGTIKQYAMLPAEINLNRNKSAAVSANYASSVRQIFVEIGDTVKEDDILASLKNRSTLSNYTVSSPINGVVISKNVSLGELVDEGEMMFEVADLSSVWVDVNIFPKYRHLIKEHQEIEFVASDNHSMRGKIDYISPIVSKDTRTFTARCILNNPTVDFMPGAFIKARMEILKKEYAVCIERSAVQTLDGENVVFVKGANGFEAQVVKLGAKDEKMVEIQSGLHNDESYVSHGSFSLKAEIVTSGIDPHAGHGH